MFEKQSSPSKKDRKNSDQSKITNSVGIRLDSPIDDEDLHTIDNNNNNDNDSNNNSNNSGVAEHAQEEEERPHHTRARSTPIMTHNFPDSRLNAHQQPLPSASPALSSSFSSHARAITEKANKLAVRLLGEKQSRDVIATLQKHAAFITGGARSDENNNNNNNGDPSSSGIKYLRGSNNVQGRMSTAEASVELGEVQFYRISKNRFYGLMPRYGFPRSSDPQIAEIEEYWEKRYAQEQANLKMIWVNYALNNGGPYAIWKSSKYLKALVRDKGITAKLRPKLWMDCSGAWAKMAQNEGYYANILRKHPTPPESMLQIEADLPRTFPDHPLFNIHMDTTGVDMMRRILVAYSWRNPKISYCQSFNFIVATFLLFLTEEQSFWLFVVLIEEILPANFYDKNLTGMRLDVKVFEDLLQQRLPKVYNQLVRFGIDPCTFIPGWMLRLYVDVFPMETVLRMWDIMFVEAEQGSKLLFRGALAFLRMNEDKILEAKDPAEIYILVNQGPQSVYDAQHFIKVCWSFHLLKWADLCSLRRKCVEAFQREEEERLQRANRSNSSSSSSSASSFPAPAATTTTNSSNNQTGDHEDPTRSPSEQSPSVSSIASSSNATSAAEEGSTIAISSTARDNNLDTGGTNANTNTNTNTISEDNDASSTDASYGTDATTQTPPPGTEERKGSITIPLSLCEGPCSSDDDNDDGSTTIASSSAATGTPKRRASRSRRQLSEGEDAAVTALVDPLLRPEGEEEAEAQAQVEAEVEEDQKEEEEEEEEVVVVPVATTVAMTTSDCLSSEDVCSYWQEVVSRSITDAIASDITTAWHHSGDGRRSTKAAPVFNIYPGGGADTDIDNGNIHAQTRTPLSSPPTAKTKTKWTIRIKKKKVAIKVKIPKPKIPISERLKRNKGGGGGGGGPTSPTASTET